MMFPTEYLLVLSVLLTGPAFCQTLTPACLEQDDKLAICVSRLSALSPTADIASTCRELESFFVCVREVEISCPDNPLLHDAGFIGALEASTNSYESTCQRNLTQILCDRDALFERFAPICYPIVWNAPRTTSIEVMCGTQRLYERCLTRANAPCVNAENNLARGLSIARTGLRVHCSDENLQEQSEIPLDESTRDISDIDSILTGALDNSTIPEQDCSEHGVGRRIAMCSRHIIPTVGNSEMRSKHICRYSRRYLRCVRRLMQRCPNAEEHQHTIYRPFHEDMVNLCEVDTRRCPFDIMEGATNMLEYCVKDNLDTEVGSPGFCRDMAALPRCLIRMKNRCRNRGFRRRHINDWISAANATMAIYCQDDIEARSLMMQPLELDMEERSELSGQYDDDDGDEVEKLRSVVNMLTSAQKA